jgi:primosomal protein N'
MKKYKAKCKMCGVILKSKRCPFAIELWPWTYRTLTCWFCGHKHITDINIEYEGFK